MGVTAAMSTDKQSMIPDGRYEGNDTDIFVVLRVDVSGLGIVSGDVHRDPGGQRDFVASFRSAPGVPVTVEGGRQPAVWEDGLGLTTTGAVEVSAGAGATVTLVFRLDERLNGMPPGRDIALTLGRVGDEVRELALEIETEEGVDPPESVEFGDRTLTFQDGLRAAGFTVRDAGQPTAIPLQPGGWDTSREFTVLHDLMVAAGQARTDRAAWELHLLLLDKAKDDPGGGVLLGIMYDDAGLLPRQGCAIFAGSIRRTHPDNSARAVIKTTVHELGHALNLRHRFEREIGRADSSSFMNYDWRYRGGQFEEEYWQAFSYTFDSDELEFLRHAPRSQVMPGKSPFLSARYWSHGTGGYSPYLPEIPNRDFAIGLRTPASGALFLFGQPVFLEVVLKNRTTSPIQVPAELLDPKGFFLELRIIRRTVGPTSPTDGMTFQPMMRRCYDTTEASLVTIAPGETITNNINLTFGSSGFSFAEPGTYDIVPILSMPIESQELGQPVDLVTTGAPLRITIAHPHTLSHERDAMTLLRQDVGAWFALGGNPLLDKAHNDLAEIRTRRTAEAGIDDPIAAAITRTQALDAARPDLRFADGRYTQHPARPERAAELLGALTEQALATFDQQTARKTAQMADQLTTDLSQ
jgi:hypothetical protein